MRLENNMNEDDPFNDYYNETFRPDPPRDRTPPDVGKENEEFLRSLEEKVVKKDVSTDAKMIKVGINAFIRNLTELIDKVFAQEKEKGTRLDLIVTLVVGGLAFTVANVFYLVTKNLKVKMTAEQYETTFLGMYRSALKDIHKDEE